MATKIIKFHDNNTTYVPVTLASAVQYSYTGGFMSVQDALGTVAQAVISSTTPLTTKLDDLQTAYNTHYQQKVNLTYDSTNGIGLDGIHAGDKKIKIVGGTNVTVANSTSGNTTTLTINGPETPAVQKLDANGATNPSIRLDSGTNGSVQVKGSAATTGYAAVYVSYTSGSSGGIVIKATYTDTDTKNTAGSTNDAAKLFLVGAKSQGDNPQTFSNSAVYTQGGTTYSTTFQATTLKGNLDGTIDSTTTATTQSASDDSTKVATTAFVHDVVDGALTSALKYKGTVASNTELSGKTKTQGDVWVVSTAGDYTVTSNGSTTATSQHLEPGDYLICNGTTWDAVNGENQVLNGTDVLEVPYTTTAGSAATIATVDGTDLTLTAKHASVTYTSPALTALTPAHGGNFTVIGNVEVTNGHVTKLHTQKVTLPNETKLSRTGTAKSATLTHGSTFTYISNINVNDHAITYDYTTATLPSQGPDYGQIKVIKHSSATTDNISTSASDVTLLSKNDNELVTFESVNKWLHIKGTESTTAGSDNVQFSHALKGNGGTAALKKIAWDEAGHIGASADVTIAKNLKYDVYPSDVDFTLPIGTAESTENTIVTNIS